jgi:hypothetical protein
MICTRRSPLQSDTLFHRLVRWLVFASVTIWPALSPAAPTRVDIELVLAVDVSQSMDHVEQGLQRDGYVAAFRHRDVVRAILAGVNRRIAVTYLEWGDAGAQTVVVPWRIIGSAGDAEGFAGELAVRPISQAQRTSISDALRAAAGLFARNEIVGLRQVIDISGDGPNNQGHPVAIARDEVVRSGVVINGLPFVVRRPDSMSSFFSVPDIDNYYAHCVVGGRGSFVMRVRRKEEFKIAIRRKLIQEISGWNAQPGGHVHKAQFATPQQAYDCLVGEKLWDGFQKE